MKKRSLRRAAAPTAGLPVRGAIRKSKIVAFSLWPRTKSNQGAAQTADDGSNDSDDKDQDQSSNSSISLFHASVMQSMAGVCDSTHEGRLVLDADVPIHVDRLFFLLFSENSAFFRQFHEHRNSTDISLGGWQTNKDGQRVRLVSMTLELGANVGPKTVIVQETQTQRACTHRGHLYSIDGQSVNEGVPYADAFVVHVHYCLVRLPNLSTNLLVLARIEFVQSVWALIKAFIIKNSIESLIEFFGELHKHLLEAGRISHVIN